MLTTFDFLTIGTVLVCLILSAMRGLVRELLGLFGWIAAFIAARTFALSAADTFLPTMSPRELAVVCGFVLVYFITRAITMVLSHLMDLTIKKTHLTLINRFLGAHIGVLKGVFLVALGVLICSFSSLPKSPAWQNAVSAPFFESIAAYFIPYFPDFLKKQMILPHSGSLPPGDTPAVEQLKPTSNLSE